MQCKNLEGEEGTQVEKCEGLIVKMFPCHYAIPCIMNLNYLIALMYHLCGLLILGVDLSSPAKSIPDFNV